MDFPVCVIGCPLLRKTLDGADGGYSFLFCVATNRGASEADVEGRLDFVSLREDVGLVLTTPEVTSLRGTTAGA